MAEGGMTGAQWAQLAAGIGAAGVGAYVSNRNSRRQQEGEDEDREMTEEQHLRQTALAESGMDPFRHQMFQGRNLTSLDMLQNMGRGGRSITPPANVAPYAGNVRRGYEPSQTLRDHASQLYNSVASGNTAPTMTDPANYGKTSALNLNAGQPGGSSAPAPAAEMVDPLSYLPGREARRNEGAGGAISGMVKGASTGAGVGAMAAGVGAVPGALIGGAAGLIGGAFTKNAKTAATDLSLEQAKQAIQAAYQSELGRPASEEEVMGRIAGTGWEPGDEWVGEQGLLYHIREIQNSTERRNRPRAA
jgi:hypothetical protein